MTAPDPAALLAAMEAAAREYQAAETAYDVYRSSQNWLAFTMAQDAYQTACIAAAPVVAGFSAALRASQEREAAAVAALEPALDVLGFHEGSAAPAVPDGHPVVQINGEDFQTALDWLRMGFERIRARKDAAP